MTIAMWITGILLTIGFGGSGVAKVSGQAAMKQAAEHFNIPWERFRMIGFLEIAGVLAIVLGLIWSSFIPLSIAAGVGLALIGIIGSIMHMRAGDKVKDFAPAAVLGLVGVAFVIIASATL